VLIHERTLMFALVHCQLHTPLSTTAVDCCHLEHISGAQWLYLGRLSLCSKCRAFNSTDALIWNLADIPITDNGSEISADTDSRSDVQLCSNFLPLST